MKKPSRFDLRTVSGGNYVKLVLTKQNNYHEKDIFSNTLGRNLKNCYSSQLNKNILK